jgi:acetyl-CoA acetyltransferase
VPDGPLERQACISGLGLSQMGRRTGRRSLDLTLESALAAIADAGLTREDIDGLASVGDVTVAQLQDALRIEMNWHATGMQFGGLLSPVISACLAIAAGLARHVLVYRTVQAAQMGSGSGDRATAAKVAGSAARVAGSDQWTLPYHVYGTIGFHAMMARRHMHLYGTKKEHLGQIALAARYHAGFNEQAAYRDPLSMEDYMSARPICEPFGLYDCDAPIDGSVALIVSRAEYAGDAPSPAVHVNSVGGAIRGRGSTWDQRSDFPGMMMSDSAEQLWARTDLRPRDVDVAQIYDGFSYIALAWLEALGFCGKGEGGAFVEGGERIRLGGELPVNTYGGQLSAGRMHSYWLLHEACLQLRGQAGPRQVSGAEVAVAAAGSGPAGGCLLLTR